ncbi:hypothetical protein PoMZ_07606 [Pyricularia oryzae]|uniref:Uncharacterized protein n=1 Tax=Pyricularia oryzae TaxID=318829 RepID=A0A4P7NFJ3_PYROR|nr:hypothetical protein PoMZ_07606 [Pyricularia oryzae]
MTLQQVWLASEPCPSYLLLLPPLEFSKSHSLSRMQKSDTQLQDCRYSSTVTSVEHEADVTVGVVVPVGSGEAVHLAPSSGRTGFGLGLLGGSRLAGHTDVGRAHLYVVVQPSPLTPAHLPSAPQGHATVTLAGGQGQSQRRVMLESTAHSGVAQSRHTVAVRVTVGHLASMEWVGAGCGTVRVMMVWAVVLLVGRVLAKIRGSDNVNISVWLGRTGLWIVAETHYNTKTPVHLVM